MADDSALDADSSSTPGTKSKRTKTVGKKRSKSGIDLIMQAVEVGLKPKKLAIAAVGVFLAMFLSLATMFVGLELAGPEAGLVFAFPGLVIAWALYFATFAAISRMCALELQGKKSPKLADLVAFFTKNAVSIFGIPFALLLGTAVLLFVEYLLGWLGAIPYVGILFLAILMLVFFVINIAVSVVWLLGMWLIFPIVAIEKVGPAEHAKKLVDEIRSRPVSYIMDLGMVMLVLLVLGGMVVMIFVSAFGLTQGVLAQQSGKYVQNTIRSALGGDVSPSRYESRSYDREYKPPSKTELFLMRIFGELLITLMLSVICAVTYSPLICVFFSGGCAAYLNARKGQPAKAT